MFNKFLSFGRLKSVGLPALLFGVILTAVLVGCFSDFAPMAPSEDTAVVEQPHSNGSIYFAFSPRALQRAAKLVDGGISVSKNIGPSGGVLTVSEGNLQVQFSVPRNAVTENVKITMTIYGNDLENLVIEFAPSGLVFFKAAMLEIRIGDALVSIPILEITAYHQYEDGTVEEAEISVEDNGANVRITIEVSGFSRYGMAD